MAGAGCSSCIKDAYIQISRDNFATAHELPAVQRVTKSYQDNQANRTRHSHSGGQFVSPCGTSSRTAVYQVQALFCSDDPINWYLRDGDIVKVKIWRGRSAPLVGFNESLEVKYVDGGWDWDNTTEDGEQYTFTLEATSAVTKLIPTGSSVPYPTG